MHSKVQMTNIFLMHASCRETNTHDHRTAPQKKIGTLCLQEHLEAKLKTLINNACKLQATKHT